MSNKGKRIQNRVNVVIVNDRLTQELAALKSIKKVPFGMEPWESKSGGEKYISLEYTENLQETESFSGIIAPSEKSEILPCLLFCIRQKYGSLIEDEDFGCFVDNIYKSQVLEEIERGYDFIDWETTIGDNEISYRLLYDAFLSENALMYNCMGQYSEIPANGTKRNSISYDMVEWKDIGDPTNTSGIDAVSLDAVGLSVRTYNCLMRAGIDTIAKILALTEEDYKEIRNLGNRGKLEVTQVVESLKNTLN